MQGRVLGIDFGTKRIGLAVSDPMGIIAHGLPTLQNKNLPGVLNSLESIISEHVISEIVVGLPLTMSASVGKAALSARKFITEIERKFSLPIVLWDERLTTVLAERTLKEMGKSPSMNKAKVDEISAVLILQSYLDNANHKNKGRNS